VAGGSLDLRAAEFWIGWRGGRWQLRARAVYDEKRMEGGREGGRGVRERDTATSASS